MRGTALGLYRVIQVYIGIVEEKMETRGEGPAIRTVAFGRLNADRPFMGICVRGLQEAYCLFAGHSWICINPLGFPNTKS